MSILKQKIKACKKALQLKHAQLKKQESSPIKTKELPHKPSNNKQSNRMKNSSVKKRQRLQGDCFTPKIYLQAKNIVTNFGKAIATFAMSELALPYLTLELEKEGFENLIKPDEFVEFVKSSKGKINSIEGLRSLILIEENDSPKAVAFKKCFQTLAEIFIKFFSVNWIIHGRVTYKLEHLKFRFRMLRRIKNPEVFTYLKGNYEKRKKLLEDSAMSEESCK